MIPVVELVETTPSDVAHAHRRDRRAASPVNACRLMCGADHDSHDAVPRNDGAMRPVTATVAFRRGLGDVVFEWRECLGQPFGW